MSQLEQFKNKVLETLTDEASKYRVMKLYEEEMKNEEKQDNEISDSNEAQPSYSKQTIITISENDDRRNDELFRNARIIK